MVKSNEPGNYCSIRRMEYPEFQTGIFGRMESAHELNKLASLPMCGFIAQLVDHCTGIAEAVTGSNPVEALIFSGFFFPIA